MPDSDPRQPSAATEDPERFLDPYGNDSIFQVAGDDQVMFEPGKVIARLELAMERVVLAPFQDVALDDFVSIEELELFVQVDMVPVLSEAVATKGAQFLHREFPAEHAARPIAADWDLNADTGWTFGRENQRRAIAVFNDACAGRPIDREQLETGPASAQGELYACLLALYLRKTAAIASLLGGR